MAVKKVTVTLPEGLFEMVERAREIEHRSRSEVVQEALRTHFGVRSYVPTEQERHALDVALAEHLEHPDSGRSWEDVRRELWPDA